MWHTWGGIKFIQNFCRKTWKEEAARDVGCDFLEWIDLAKCRDHWMAHISENSGTMK